MDVCVDAPPLTGLQKKSTAFAHLPLPNTPHSTDESTTSGLSAAINGQSNPNFCSAIRQDVAELDERETSFSSAFLGCMFTLGDTVAQECIEKKEHHDWPRTLRAIVYGSCIAGPLIGTWLGVLNRKVTVQSHFKGVLVRLAIDSIVFMPFFQGVFLTSISVLEGRSFLELQNKFRTSFFTLLRNAYCVWPMVNFVSFMFVPPPFRPLLNSTISVGWNAFLSYQNQLALHHGASVSPLGDNNNDLISSNSQQPLL
ncbi:hypothetical protein BX666DRAFT_1851816 [Dichotomocladium elegans]|nr:hypothetical protein BX666DRAFT_1851816 [Dichotomocladium elegans]